MVTTRSANRPATRSTTKRHSTSSKTTDSPQPQDSASKRQKLPLRKKTGAASSDPSSDPAEPDTPQVKRTQGKRKKDAREEDGAEDKAKAAADSIVVNAPEVEVANDMDAMLQSQLAEQHPETPVLEKEEEEAKGQAAQGKKAVHAAPAPAAAEDSDSDSDDDAPEAISNVQAASSAKQAAQAAQKAAKEESERLKKKRKERDNLYKEQAQAKKAKEPTEQPAQQPATAPEQTSEEAAEEGSDDAMKDDALTLARPGKFQPPALLPEEFLDSDSDSDQQLDPSAAGPQRKKRKTAVPGSQQQKDKAPRDKKVGGTIYRVVKAADSRLAPRGQKTSAGVRARLLARNREGVTPQRGFLVGRSKGTPDWGSSRRG